MCCTHPAITSALPIDKNRRTDLISKVNALIDRTRQRISSLFILLSRQGQFDTETDVSILNGNQLQLSMHTANTVLSNA